MLFPDYQNKEIKNLLFKISFINYQKSIKISLDKKYQKISRNNSHNKKTTKIIIHKNNENHSYVKVL